MSKKTVNKSHQIRTNCGVLSPQRKCCFSPKKPKAGGLVECGCARAWHCWWCAPAIPSLALLVCLAVLPQAAEMFHLNPAWHLHPMQHPHLWSHCGRLPDSCKGRWKKSIRWFSLTTAPRPSYFTQLFLYSTNDCVWDEHGLCLARAWSLSNVMEGHLKFKRLKSHLGYRSTNIRGNRQH